MQYISFSADKDSRLKNGDTITVTALISKSNEEKLAEKFGKIPGVTKKNIRWNLCPIMLQSG